MSDSIQIKQGRWFKDLHISDSNGNRMLVSTEKSLLIEPTSTNRPDHLLLKCANGAKLDFDQHPPQTAKALGLVAERLSQNLESMPTGERFFKGAQLLLGETTLSTGTLPSPLTPVCNHAKDWLDKQR